MSGGGVRSGAVGRSEILPAASAGERCGSRLDLGPPKDDLCGERVTARISVAAFAPQVPALRDTEPRDQAMPGDAVDAGRVWAPAHHARPGTTGLPA